MTISEESRIWMTSDALAGLKNELAQLTSAEQQLSPSDQKRIATLRRLIRRADTGPKPDDGLVEPGMTVTIRFEQDGSTQTLLLGERDLVATVVDIVVCSPDSPLGSAVVGHYVGDRITYDAPSGPVIEATILSATPFNSFS